MNERIKELMLECYSPYSNFDYEKFASLIWQEAINTVKETPTHCAFTTYDLPIVKCTIDKSVEILEKKFKNEKGVL